MPESYNVVVPMFDSLNAIAYDPCIQISHQLYHPAYKRNAHSSITWLMFYLHELFIRIEWLGIDFVQIMKLATFYKYNIIQTCARRGSKVGGMILS
jgi:hypothetical protein